MRIKTTIRFTDNEKELINDVAEYLHWTKTEVLRRSLRYGINALLKFETNKEMDLKEFDKKRKPGQTTVTTSGNPTDQDQKNKTKDKWKKTYERYKQEGKVKKMPYEEFYEWAERNLGRPEE